MCPHRDALTDEGAGACAQDQVEGILCIDSKAANLCAVHLQWARDVSSLLAISVETQRNKVGRSKLNRIPLKNDRGLGGIAAS